MTTQEQDFPDSPGWWAWESAYDDRRWVRHLIVWEEHGDGLVRMQWEDWSKPDLVYVDKFLAFNRGKWTRLHMPWEQPAPAAPTIPDGVREAMRVAVNVAREHALSDANDGSDHARQWASRYDKALAWLDAQRGEPTS